MRRVVELLRYKKVIQVRSRPIGAYTSIMHRDQATQHQLDDLNDAYRLFRCRTIMNCSEVCPKGLRPSRAIEKIPLRMVRESL